LPTTRRSGEERERNGRGVGRVVMVVEALGETPR
jgi:hypothetical protein